MITNPEDKRKGRKHYYLTGFKLFLKRFIDSNQSIKHRISEKMEIYFDENFFSDLTFFVGKKLTDESKIGLLLINEPPFCQNGTPILAFETKNKRIIDEMMKMFHGVMTTSKRYCVDDILNEALK